MFEEVEKLDEQIGKKVDPEEQALAMLRQWQEMTGIVPDEALKQEMLANAWMYNDEEIPGNFMGSGRND